MNGMNGVQVHSVNMMLLTNKTCYSQRRNSHTLLNMTPWIVDRHAWQ